MMSMEAPTMARKRSHKPILKRDDLVAVRCFPEYKVWIQQFAEDTHHTPTQLIEMALIDLAKKLGYAPPPKR